VAGWDGEPQDVAEGAGVRVRHRPRQARDLRRQHRLRRDEPPDGAQPPAVVGGGDALGDEAVDVLAGEPDPHPHAGDDVGRHPGRDRVVEQPVEVRQRHVDDDARHRQLCRGRVGWLGPVPARGSPQQLQLLRPGLPLRHAPILPPRADTARTTRAAGASRGLW
jgi:hypothetical protein